MNPIEKMVEIIRSENLWSQEFELQRGKFLCNQNIIDTKLYFVKSGSLRAYLVDKNGEEQIIRFAYKNSIFSALDSFMTGKPTKLNIQPKISIRKSIPN